MGIRHQIDELFFDNWSAEMAYVLGLWYADGYMRIDKSYRISIASNDRELLMSVLQAMQASQPISKHKERCWRITICSKRLYGQLLALGCRPHKSYAMTFPLVPNPYLPDFIRGYFDGDGSVFYVNYKSTKDKISRSELRSNFTSGSERFLSQLRLILNQVLGLTLKKFGFYNNGGSIKLGYGTKDTKKLLHYLYYLGFTIGLARKARFVNYV